MLRHRSVENRLKDNPSPVGTNGCGRSGASAQAIRRSVYADLLACAGGRA